MRFLLDTQKSSIQNRRLRERARMEELMTAAPSDIFRRVSIGIAGSGFVVGCQIWRRRFGDLWMFSWGQGKLSLLGIVEKERLDA